MDNSKFQIIPKLPKMEQRKKKISFFEINLTFQITFSNTVQCFVQLIFCEKNVLISVWSCIFSTANSKNWIKVGESVRIDSGWRQTFLLLLDYEHLTDLDVPNTYFVHLKFFKLSKISFSKYAFQNLSDCGFPYIKFCHDLIIWNFLLHI